MAKSTSRFDLSGDGPVAERIRLFWESFPNGRITTRLVSRTEHDVIFEARVYRSVSDTEPAATGWAAEREDECEGDNARACLENTETSAVGRALANLGFTAVKECLSMEEMQKAMRARPELAGRRVPEPGRFQPVRTPTAEALDVYQLDAVPRQSYANIVSDLLHLVECAERQGLRATRARYWREILITREFPPAYLTACERRLRAWLAKSAEQ